MPVLRAGKCLESPVTAYSAAQLSLGVIPARGADQEAGHVDLLGDGHAEGLPPPSVPAVNEEPEPAAWLWGAAEALRQSIGAREAPASHDTHERLKAQAREQIGEAAFATQWAAGRTAPLTEAIERALHAEAGA